MTRKDKFRQSRKKKAVILSLVLFVLLSVGMTMAYLVSHSKPVVNKFLPSHIDIKVEEKFDGRMKEKINVRNSGNTEAYIRVKLVSYRVNEEGQKIGGNALVPDFTPGINWVKHNGFYYYTQPVLPGNTPNEFLIGQPGIELIEYEDADGGKQVVEVMAEGIQSEPVHAHEEAWSVTIRPGNVEPYTGGGE